MSRSDDSKGHSNNKSVRFANLSSTTTDDGNTKRSQDHIADIDNDPKNDDHRSIKKSKTHKDKFHMNEDEIDDVDDWKPNMDDDDNDVHTMKHIINAKRNRRKKRDIGDEELYDDHDDIDSLTTTATTTKSTRIDYRTSLAAEGITVEPFSMEQEQNDGSGYFDGDTYVFRKRNEEDHEPDAWVDSLNEQTNNISTTDDNDTFRKNEERRKQRANEMDSKMDNWTIDDLYAKLLLYLVDNETVMGALVRYGNMMKRTKNNKMDVPDTITEERRQQAHDSFNIVTEASNALLLKGKIDIYQMTRRDIESLCRPAKQTVNEEKSLSDRCSIQWEYRGNSDDKIHGPYSTDQMLGWVQAGYFVGPAAVQVRPIHHSTIVEKSMQEDLLSDLLDDNDDDGAISSHSEQYERGEWILSDKVNFQKYLN